MSRTLRESDPTPAEVHFFASGREPGKRRKLIDIFIQERQAKKAAEDAKAERARAAAPPYDPSRIALLGAKRPRPVAELIAILEARADAIAEEIARLRGRE